MVVLDVVVVVVMMVNATASKPVFVVDLKSGRIGRFDMVLIKLFSEVSCCSDVVEVVEVVVNAAATGSRAVVKTTASCKYNILPLDCFIVAVVYFVPPVVVVEVNSTASRPDV